MKRIILFILTCFLFAVKQLFAYDFTANDVNGNAIYYTYLGGDSVAVTYDVMLQSSYTGDIVIPSEIHLELSVYRVASIGNYAFCGSTLTSVTIPNSITHIGKSAFYGCSNLSSIEIPESVTDLGETAFGYCKNLVSIDLHNSLTSIANNTFLNCVGLTSVTLPESITNIGKSAFDGCMMLSSLSIPSNVSSIGDYAFSSCLRLDSIVVPNTVTSIGNNAFLFIRNIVYNGDATGSPWGGRSVNGYSDGALVYSDENKQTLLACAVTATDVVIPESVTDIGPNAFYHCDSLSSIEIPNNVSSIGDEAFFSCSTLDTVVCTAIVPPAIGQESFGYISTTAVLCVPYETINAYKAISGYADYFAEIKGFSDVEDITATTATLKWIPDTAVIQYDINIYTSDTLFAHYVVDGDGNITSSQRFAPSIYHQKLDTTTSSTDYFVITLNGLSAGTDYDYTIDGTDAQSSPVYHEEGTFTTLNEDEDGFFDAIADDHKKQMQKILQEGQLYIIQGEDMITIQGIKVNQ